MSPVDQCSVWWITAKKSRRLCAHLCSWAAMCTESIIRRRASEICLALIVCCSNLVFTADCEMHSCKDTRIWESDRHISTNDSLKALNTHLKPSFKVLELKHSRLKAFSQSTTWNPKTTSLQASYQGKEDFSCSFKNRSLMFNKLNFTMFTLPFERIFDLRWCCNTGFPKWFCEGTAECLWVNEKLIIKYTLTLKSVNKKLIRKNYCDITCIFF